MKEQGQTPAGKEGPGSATPQPTGPAGDHQQSTAPPSAATLRSATATPQPPPATADVLSLQRTVGNRATGRALAQRARPASKPATPAPAQPQQPIVQRLFNEVQIKQKIGLGTGLVDTGQPQGPASMPAGYALQFRESSKKAYLKNLFITEMQTIKANPAFKALQLASLIREIDLGEDALDKKSIVELQQLYGKLKTIQKGLGNVAQMHGPELKRATAEFFKVLSSYQKVLSESTAAGLLSAPEFVLDQVFGKQSYTNSKGQKKTVKGASAGNLDIGVGDALAAHHELTQAAYAYLILLNRQKATDLVKNFESYLPEIEQEKEYMYVGLKENREQTSMNLADAINKGRAALGKSDVGKLEGMSMGQNSDALPKDTPLGFLPPEKTPGLAALEGPHKDWLAGPEGAEPKPDISALTMSKELGKGTEGEVSLYEGPGAEEGADPRQFAVKTSRSAGRENLLKEMAAYKHVGAHRNLPKVHGMGAVKFGQDKRPAMVMDFVQGPTGERAMQLLRKKATDGALTPTEYWGAIQFITRRLVSVIKHLASKDMAHNDIKPENFMIDERGEPVLIDLGMHSQKGQAPPGTTPAFAPAQLSKAVTSGEETDLFMVASTMLAGVESWKQPKTWTDSQWSPKKGLDEMPERGASVAGAIGDRNMQTEYEAFLSLVLRPDAQAETTIAQAEELPFLSTPLIDDGAAKGLLAALSTREARPEESWEDIAPRWAPREAGQAAKNRRKAPAGPAKAVAPAAPAPDPTPAL